METNYTFLFVKCKDTQILIEGKCKTILLENCEGVKLIVDSLMTNIDVINCKKTTVTIKGQ